MSPEPDGQPPNPKGSIVFFHPDLGIGGAERLVVDAAVGLQSRGHRVVIFTNHCDPKHCFDECRDGTLDVRVRGNWLIPPSILSRLTILCVILRHFHLLLHISLNGELRTLNPRAFIVDQLSAGLPLLRFLAPSTPILFYCHFPDLLLARGRESPLKRLYRRPFDWLEEFTMGFASAVAVNSSFTKGVVDQTWPELKKRVETKVVYPCVDTETRSDVDQDSDTLFKDEKIILSINRFERKKNIDLAIKAFAAIPESERKGVRLIIAGGYDHRVSENVEYHSELESLASSHNLDHLTTKNLISALSAPSPTSVPVLFLLSIPNSLKDTLLRSARLLLYTPTNEHFGIVPLEAMLARTPVLAADSGGPVETIVDGQTGWLRSPDDIPAWTEVVRKALGMQDSELETMGENGAKRVHETFGRDNMSARLDDIINEIVSKKRPAPGLAAVISAAGLLLVCVGGLVIAALLARQS